MPQALIAAAQWVGTQLATYAVEELGASLATAHVIYEAATVATLLAETAAISAASQLLAPKVGGNFGSQVDWKADPQAGLPYAVGRTGVAGNIVFKQSAGTKSSYLNTVSVYTCAGPIDSYEGFSVNAVATAFGTDSGEGATGFYQNKMWRLTQLGASPESGYLHPTATGTKDTPADHSGLPTEWSSSHKLSGYAADLWILDFDTGRYAGGVPQRLTVGKWVKYYDPRLDGTYPGGSGAQRSNDESTWTWGENPYLHALTWLIGRKQNGVRIIGVGIPIAAIDVAAFVAGANVADANGWTCGGLVYSTDDKYEVLKAFLQAGGGKPMRLGAKVSCLVNTPRTSLATIRSADVVGSVEVAGGTSRRNRINTIWPKYREEDQAWEMVVPDAPVTVASYYTADGGQRSRGLEYPLVQHVDQVAQLARYDIEDGRELTPITLPCKPIWMGYAPGDVITADEAEWGLVGQPLLILKRTRDPGTMQVTLTCRTETDAKHAFALGQTGTAPSTPALVPYDPNNFAAPGAGIYTANGSTLAGAGASTTAAVTVTATTNAPDNPYATALLIRYRVHGTTAWAYLSAQIGVDHVDITSVVEGTQYDVEVGYRSVRGTESPYTACAGGPFTAGVATVSGIAGPGGTVLDWTKLANSLAPVGQNAIVNSEFLAGGDPPTGWIVGLNNTGLTLTSSLVATNTFKAAKGVISGTPTVGKQFDAYTQDFAKPSSFLTPVLPNDWVGASARVAYQNCSGVNLYIVFYDATGALVSSVVNGAAGGANVNGDTVDPATYGLMSMVAQAPATAKWAQFVVRALCDGTHASPALWMMQPLLDRLPTNASALTAVPPYTPGPALRNATSNVVTYSASAPSSPANGDTWVDTSVTPNVTRFRVAGAWQVGANLTTNTNQITDGANLGGTATWTGVTGTGKPADNATVNRLTASSSAPGSPVDGDVWIDTSVSGRPLVKTRISGAWVAGSIPPAIVQNLDVAGNMTIWTALPGYNNSSGMGVTMSLYPFTSDDTHIYGAAFTLAGLGASQSVPSVTFSGLTANTSYAIVYNWANGGAVYAPIAPSAINTYVLSPDGWVVLGVVRTTNSGVYTAPAVPPAYIDAGGGPRYQYNFA